MTKQEAIDLLDNLIGFVEDNQNNDYDEALKMAIEALSIDIVRCKYCVNNPKGIGWIACTMTGANTRKPDDFCSYGERGDSDDD